MIFFAGKNKTENSQKTVQTEIPRAMHKTVLSTIDVARLFNVTETTVKRWADEGMLRCQKTPGGHRKFPIRSVIEFAEAHNFEPIGALALPDSDGLGGAIQLAIIKRDFSVLEHAFVEKALSPDKADLYIFFSYLYEHRVPLWEIYDRVLRPGMAEIGARWARGAIGISQEHRASYETLDALAKLQNEILIKPSVGKTAVFAALGEELHEIGLRCASYLFESEGWQTHYLGARIPAADVIAASKEFKPAVLALSVTGVSGGQEAAQQLTQVGEAVYGNGTKVLVGGSGVPAEIREQPWLAGVVSTSRELLEFIAEEYVAHRNGRSSNGHAHR